MNAVAEFALLRTMMMAGVCEVKAECLTAFEEMKDRSAYKVRCRTDARSCFLPALVLTIK